MGKNFSLYFINNCLPCCHEYKERYKLLREINGFLFLQQIKETPSPPVVLYATYFLSHTFASLNMVLGLLFAINPSNCDFGPSGVG